MNIGLTLEPRTCMSLIFSNAGLTLTVHSKIFPNTLEVDNQCSFNVLSFVSACYSSRDIIFLIWFFVELIFCKVLKETENCYCASRNMFVVCVEFHKVVQLIKSINL